MDESIKEEQSLILVYVVQHQTAFILSYNVCITEDGRVHYIDRMVNRSKEELYIQIITFSLKNIKRNYELKPNKFKLN